MNSVPLYVFLRVFFFFTFTPNIDQFRAPARAHFFFNFLCPQDAFGVILQHPLCLLDTSRFVAIETNGLTVLPALNFYA